MISYILNSFGIIGRIDLSRTCWDVSYCWVDHASNIDTVKLGCHIAGARSIRTRFTQIQQDALSRCINNETNSLGPTPSY
jgi:hypothetical protein